jgi:hypothetical protein
MRFLYFYLMSHARARVQAVAPEHAVYWRELGLPDYLGGPFGDRSGGLITFETGSANEAERLVVNDPFVREDLLEGRYPAPTATRVAVRRRPSLRLGTRFVYRSMPTSTVTLKNAIAATQLFRSVRCLNQRPHARQETFVDLLS